MNQIGRYVMVLYGSLLRRGKINQVFLPQTYSVLSAPRNFLSQNLSDDIEPNEVEIEFCNRSAKETLSQCLRGIYECSQDDIKRMLNKYPSLLRAYHRNVLNNAKCLKENGLNKSNLIAHPWVLEYNSQLFPSAIKLLKVFHHDVNLSLPFLIIPYKKLLQLAKGAEENSDVYEKSKIEWLSEILECNEQKLSQVLMKHYTILGMSRDRILYILNILKGGGVPLESIVKDICIFKHNSEVMVQRLAEAQEKNIGPLKPWSLRCSEKTFQRTVERKVKAKEFLGDHESVKDYLTTRLQCDEEIISYIFAKIPQLKHITVMKVKDLLDYLYEVGYSPLEICQAPRILTRSVRTIKGRVEELQLLNIVHPNLLVLCKTTKEYKELISKLKSSQ